MWTLRVLLFCTVSVATGYLLAPSLLPQRPAAARTPASGGLQSGRGWVDRRVRPPREKAQALAPQTAPASCCRSEGRYQESDGGGRQRRGRRHGKGGQEGRVAWWAEKRAQEKRGHLLVHASGHCRMPTQTPTRRAGKKARAPSPSAKKVRAKVAGEDRVGRRIVAEAGRVPRSLTDFRSASKVVPPSRRALSVWVSPACGCRPASSNEGAKAYKAPHVPHSIDCSPLERCRLSHHRSVLVPPTPYAARRQRTVLGRGFGRAEARKGDDAGHGSAGIWGRAGWCACLARQEAESPPRCEGLLAKCSPVVLCHRFTVRVRAAAPLLRMR